VRAHSGRSAEAALDFAKTVAFSCSSALGDTLVGVILHGSLATAGYLNGKSDIDLLAIVEGPLSDFQIKAMIKAARTLRARAPAPVDLRVLKRCVAQSPTKAPFMEAYLRIRPGHRKVVVESRRLEPDLTIELSVCRAHGLSLFGLGPLETIVEIPRPLVLEVQDDLLAHWQAVGDDPRSAELTVLTACRIWLFSEEGRYTSKTDAAEWVLTQRPGLEVVRDALRHRSIDARTSIDGGQVQQLLALVRARLKAELG